MKPETKATRIAAPPKKPAAAWILGAVWILAACAGIAALLAGGSWLYRTAPWKGLRPAEAAAHSVAPGSPPPSPAPAAPPASSPAVVAAPSVARFSASPDSVAAGGTATLRWEVNGAAEVRIEPQVGKVSASGARAVHPDESTTYTLTATGAGGEGSAQVSIAVTPQVSRANPAVSAKSLYESGMAESQAGNSDKAMALFRQAAEMGDVRAMLEVAEEGLDSDNGDSERWFRKAAELGDSTAMLNLGAMYQLGNHVKEDYAQAVVWYRRAAEKGNPSAMYNLGRMYERGRGVPEDLAKAKELYQKAAAKGNSDARIRLDQMTDK